MNSFIVSPERNGLVPLKTQASQPAAERAQRRLLLCGILSSVLYVVMNVVGALLYAGYSSTTQTVSELSAIGAPTRPIWVALGVVYTLLVLAFAWGVRQSAAGNRRLGVVGGLLLLYGALGLLWPLAPMHQREVLAAGGGTLSDTLHLVFAAVTVLVMLLAIGFGAAALDRPFRVYSVATLIALSFFGTLTGIDGPKLSSGAPTPWIGVWERINIGVFLVWVVVLAMVLLQKRNKVLSLA